ncbi:MAG: hypothetical protein ACM31P_06140 [Actinomycetota bacterium]
MLFVVGALRAVIELIGLCLLGQGVLYVIAGAGRERNPIYRLLALLTEPPRRLARMALPKRIPDGIIPTATFVVLFFFWIGLAFMRSFV